MENNCVCKQEKNIDIMRSEIDQLRGDIQGSRDRAVTFVMFWSVIVLFSSILGGVMSNIYSQIDEIDQSEKQFHADIEKQVNGDRLTQTRIETQLTQIQKDILEIRNALSK